MSYLSNTLKKLLAYSTLLLIITLMTHTSVFGQRIKGMAIAGGNLTQVEGDEIKGWSQFGFSGGLGAIFPIKNWGINIETLYSQKGSFQKAQFDDERTGEYRLRLNYFEIPVYATYTDKDVISFGAGGYYAGLLSAREEIHSGNVAPYTDTVSFNNYDIGFLIDVRFRVWKPLHLSVRYSQSITSIRAREYVPSAPSEPFTRQEYNQVITLRVIYLFNEGERGLRNQPR